MSAPAKSKRNERGAIPLRGRAYESFTRHLLTDGIRPGQFISQRELVEITGLPLGAIRELIPRLEAEGLVKTVPQRGMQVAYVDLDLIRAAFQFRLFLEREAVGLFAAQATDAAIADLRDRHLGIIEACERAQANGGISDSLVAEAQDVDWLLHATIIDFLDNAIIADAYRINSIKIRLIRQSQTRLNNAVVIPSMREHMTVIDAIATRDPAVAATAMGGHITSAWDRAMGMRP